MLDFLAEKFIFSFQSQRAHLSAQHVPGGGKVRGSRGRGPPRGGALLFTPTARIAEAHGEQRARCVRVLGGTVGLQLPLQLLQAGVRAGGKIFFCLSFFKY